MDSAPVEVTLTASQREQLDTFLEEIDEAANRAVSYRPPGL
jgi:hypothetical protein